MSGFLGGSGTGRKGGGDLNKDVRITLEPHLLGDRGKRDGD